MKLKKATQNQAQEPEICMTPETSLLGRINKIKGSTLFWVIRKYK